MMENKQPVTETKNRIEQKKKTRFSALFEKEHEHEFCEWQTVKYEKATEDCVQVRTCYCGKKEKRVAYKYSSGFEFEVTGNKTCRITGLGKCEDTDVHVPCFIGKYKVTEIKGAYVFSDNKRQVTSVTVPDTVKSICGGVFRGIDVLKSVTLSEGTEEIGFEAFQYSGMPKKINIPSSVKRIGMGAFQCCIGLEEITLPAGLCEIGAEAFDGCRSLKNINIPRSVKRIGHRAFSFCALNEVALPLGIEKIESEVFKGCKLEKISLPNGVTSIEKNAFAYCHELKKINIPEGVRKIGDSAFERCCNLSEVVIPHSVVEMGNAVFKECDGKNCFSSFTQNLQRLVIGNGVTKIGDEFCCRCYSLKFVKIGSGVKEIGASAFESCSSLESILIPDSVERIGKDAFYWCRSLETVIIGKGVKEICESAFVDTNLKEIKYSGTISEWIAVKRALFWVYSKQKCKVYCKDGVIDAF
jgi:hypothetical protein